MSPRATGQEAPGSLQRLALPAVMSRRQTVPLLPPVIRRLVKYTLFFAVELQRQRFIVSQSSCHQLWQTNGIEHASPHAPDKCRAQTR